MTNNRFNVGDKVRLKARPDITGEITHVCPPWLDYEVEIDRHYTYRYQEELELVPEERTAGRHVVIVGNPFDGMTVYGPFTSWDEAATWGGLGDGGDWYVLAMTAPDQDDPARVSR